MESLASPDDYSGGAGNEPDGLPKTTSTHLSNAMSEDLSKQNLAREHSHGELNRQVSMPVSLEPPPVVRRPPKIKSDSFGFGSFSLFSWNRTEKKDMSSCSRSTHQFYNQETTFRFFGFSMTKNITYEISDGGFNTAVESIRFGWLNFETSWVRDKLPQFQRRLEKLGMRKSGTMDVETPNALGQEDSSATDVERQNESTREPRSIIHPWLHDHYYIIVGFMGDESVPKETLRRIMHTDGLFQQIRKAHRHLRNPLRRAMSLKEVCGFGIYECDPHKGYHKEVEIDRETERALTELWRNYCSHKLDYEGRWLMWIHQHFNNGSKSPQKGRLALEFKLRWSVVKVVFWGILPVLLSLAIGFWYMYSEHEGVDDVAVAEAAWVIASYIVTTSALLLALLAVISQFGDI